MTVSAQEVTVYTVVDQMVLMTSPGPLDVGELPNEEDTELGPVTPGLEEDVTLADDEAPVENELEPLPMASVVDEVPVDEETSLDAELELWAWPQVQVALLQLCVCGLVTREMVVLAEDQVEETGPKLEVLAVHVVLLQVFVCGLVTRDVLLLLLLADEVTAVLLSVAELALEEEETRVEV